MPMKFKNRKYVLLLLGIILGVVAVATGYFAFQKPDYNQVVEQGYYSMLALPQDISIEELVKKGYIDLNGESGISKWKEAYQKYSEAVYYRKAYGFYFFRYPKLWFLVFNPHTVDVRLWEYDIKVGSLSNPDLAFSSLERVEDEKTIKYVLRSMKKSDLQRNYALEDKEIYSYPNN